MAAQKTIADLRAKVTELEDEVARLKKALAAAGAKAVPMIPLNTVAEVAEVIEGTPRERKAGKDEAPCATFCGKLHTHVRGVMA